MIEIPFKGQQFAFCPAFRVALANPPARSQHLVLENGVDTIHYYNVGGTMKLRFEKDANLQIEQGIFLQFLIGDENSDINIAIVLLQASCPRSKE